MQWWTAGQKARAAALEAKRKATASSVATTKPITTKPTTTSVGSISSWNVGTMSSTTKPTSWSSGSSTAPSKAANAWNAMTLQQQQNFANKNTWFDPSKYSLSYKSATWTTPVGTQVPVWGRVVGSRIYDAQWQYVGMAWGTTQATPIDTPIDTWNADVSTYDQWWDIKLDTENELQTKTADYADVQTQRLQEIRDNLSTYYDKQRDLFLDRGTFDKFFHYNDRVQEQKDILDQFFTQKEGDRQLAGMTPEQIAAQWSDISGLSPEQQQAVLEAQQNQINQDNNDSTLVSLMKQFGFTDEDSNGIMDEFENYPEVPELTDTPEIAAVKTELEDNYTRIAEIDRQIEKIRDEVTEQYPWIPETQLEAVIVDRTNSLIDERNWLLNQANNQESHIKTYQQNQANMLQQYSYEEQQMNDRVGNFSQMYWMYQSTPEGIAQTAMAEYKAANPNMDTGTPDQVYQALNTTLDGYYKTYWAIIQRPQAQVIRDVQEYAKKNKVPISQALKENFLVPLMGKPEYKQLLNESLWLSDWWEKLSDTVLYNPSTWEFRTYGGWGSSWYSWNWETDVTPSWTMETVAIGNKNVKVDSIAAQSLAAAAAELWEWIVVGEWYRDKDRYRQIVLNNQSKRNEAHPNDKITGTDIETIRKALNAKWVKIAAYEASEHTSWLAIDLYNSKWGALNGDQARIMESHGWRQTAEAGDMWHWTYQGWWEGWWDMWGGWEIIGSLWLPVSYERSVKNFVPTQLMNSELELNMLNDTIKRMYEGWVKEQDAALYFMWFNIKDEENRALATQLVNVWRAIPEDMQMWYVKTISDFMNSGNITGAIRKAEQTAMNYAKTQEWDNYVTESTTRLATQRSNEVEKLLSTLTTIPVWVVGWQMNKWLKNLKWSNAQKVQTQVTQAVAQMRNDLLWSVVTPSEEKFLQPLLPDLNDSPANFMMKLRNLKVASLAWLNSIRETYWLPSLNEQSLLSNDKLSIYLNEVDNSEEDVF